VNQLPDAWHGVHTSRHVELSSLGLDHPERAKYEPGSWRTIPSVLRQRDVGEHDVFLDLGCGAGRQLIVAAKYGFQRVIGIDLAPELIALARENVSNVKSRWILGSSRRTTPIDLVCSDVLDYDIPPTVSVVFMFNPFRGALFSAVLTKLLHSVDEYPRRLRIIYSNPHEASRLIATGRADHVRSATAGRFDVRLYEIVEKETSVS